MTTVSSSTSTTPATTSTAGTTSGTTATSGTTTNPAAVGAALITSLGLGTGINMTNLATQIAQATYADQLNNVNSQLSAVQVQISEASTLQSDVSNLASSFGSLVNGGTLSSAPTVTNSSVATASLPDGTSGLASGYTLEVDQLASPQVLASPGFSSASATTGSGTLTFSFGTISGASSTSAGSFTADPTQSAVNITVNKGDTLSQIAQDINGAGAGITAYVATTASGAQLVMQGPSGANEAFTVSATENPSDPGLSALAWNPATGPASQITESAQDAAYKIDGIAQTSHSNTVQNAAPSLSLQLTGTNAGAPTTISFSNPSSAISTAMNSFVTALNSLVGELNTDTTATSTGSLTNDQGAHQLQNQLTQLTGMVIMPNAPAGAPSTLADLGLSVNKDGTFALNSTTLSNALAKNPTGVAAMFTNGLHGIYGTLTNISIAVSNTTDPGSLAGSATYFTQQQTNLQNQISQINSEQANLRTQLISQFATANTAVANSKSTMSYLTQQIAAWQGNSNTPGL